MFFQELGTKFPEFESYSRPLQTVLLDMQYNMENKFNDEKWPQFYGGLRNKEQAVKRDAHNKNNFFISCIIILLWHIVNLKTCFLS